MQENLVDRYMYVCQDDEFYQHDTQMEEMVKGIFYGIMFNGIN